MGTKPFDTKTSTNKHAALENKNMTCIPSIAYTPMEQQTHKKKAKPNSRTHARSLSIPIPIESDPPHSLDDVDLFHVSVSDVAAVEHVGSAVERAPEGVAEPARADLGQDIGERCFFFVFVF